MLGGQPTVFGVAFTLQADYLPASVQYYSEAKLWDLEWLLKRGRAGVEQSSLYVVVPGHFYGKCSMLYHVSSKLPAPSSQLPSSWAYGMKLEG